VFHADPEAEGEAGFDLMEDLMSVNFILPEISPSLDGRAITIPPIGDTAIDQMSAAALHAARDAAERTLNACRAIWSNDLLNPAAKHCQAHELSYKVTAPGVAQLQRASERVQAEIAALRQKVNSPPTPPALMGQEIRQTLRSMTVKDRRAAVARALADGRDEIVGAILSGPAMLSGLQQLEADALKNEYAVKRHPAEVARIEKLEKDYAHLQRGGQLLLGFCVKCSDANIVQAAKRSNDAAQAAIAAAGLMH
jgi:hypothetical protein